MVDVIPAIDIRDGRCVRLLKGDYSAQTQYDFDPVELARDYAKLGCAYLHMVDLDGAKQGRPVNTDLLREMVAASKLPVQIGGGIRTTAHVEQLFAAGATRVVIGSTAINSPDLVKDWFERFGGDAIVLALDVRIDEMQVPRVCTHGWTQTSQSDLYETIAVFCEVGLRHVLCTDIDRDGMLQGPATALYQQVLERYPQLQLQASGGVGNIDDLAELREAGLPYAIVGKALLEGKISHQEISSFLRAA